MGLQIFNTTKYAVSGTPGTGTVTLGSAIPGFNSLPSSASGLPVSYHFDDTESGSAVFEDGYGILTLSGSTWTLTRNLVASTSSSLQSLTSAAVVSFTLLAADFAPLFRGDNGLRNASMDIWQRGTSALTVTTAGGYTADGFIVLPTGASVTAQQATGRGPTANSLKVTGASSVTDVIVKQRVESLVAARWTSRTITFQAQIFNNTGGSITPTLTVKHANAVDNWSASTADVSAAGLQGCPNGQWTQVAYSYTDPGNAANGLEFAIDFGNNFSTTGKSIQITEVDVSWTPFALAGALNPAPVAPQLRPIWAELPICQRYYQTSYDLGTAPGSSAVASTIILGDYESTISQNFGANFWVPMRIAPGTSGITLYDAVGNANKVSCLTGSSRIDNGGGTLTIWWCGTKAFGFTISSSIAGDTLVGHFAASAEL